MNLSYVVLFAFVSGLIASSVFAFRSFLVRLLGFLVAMISSIFLSDAGADVDIYRQIFSQCREQTYGESGGATKRAKQLTSGEQPAPADLFNDGPQ